MEKFIIDLYNENIKSSVELDRDVNIGHAILKNKFQVQGFKELGEFINFSEKPNLKPIKVLGINENFYIDFVTSRIISEGEELTVSKEDLNKLGVDDTSLKNRKGIINESNYALPDKAKYKMNNSLELKRSIQHFNDCTDILDKEILARNLYNKSKEMCVQLEENCSLINYIFEDTNVILTEAAKKGSSNSSNKKNTKRKQIEDLVYKVLSKLDKTNLNTNHYKNFFSAMDDAQFEKWVKNFLKDDEQNFYIEIQPNKNEPNLKEIKSALDIMNIPVNEFIYYRHGENKNNPLRTRYEVPVGWINVKRLIVVALYRNIQMIIPRIAGNSLETLKLQHN